VSARPATAPALAPLPAAYVAVRASLHRLACYVISPARKAVTGRIGLVPTPGGFGTPPFGAGRVVRADRDRLVVERPNGADARPITSLAAAAAQVAVTLDCDPGVGKDVPPLGDVTESLELDAAAAGALGDWYAFGWAVLAEVRAELGDDASSSELWIWPEHFDAGFSAQVADGVGCNFGASPGDRYVDTPYLYVGPHDLPLPDGEFWDAPFGATLGYDRLVAAGDGTAQREAALAFVREGIVRLRERAQRRPEA
jgi:hypothetical protein